MLLWKRDGGEEKVKNKKEIFSLSCNNLYFTPRGVWFPNKFGNFFFRSRATFYAIIKFLSFVILIVIYYDIPYLVKIYIIGNTLMKAAFRLGISQYF